MKTINSLFILVAAIVLLGSCSGNLQIEKRHYRSGWYVSRLQEKAPCSPAISVNSPADESKAIVVADSVAPLPAIQPAPDSPLAGTLQEIAPEKSFIAEGYKKAVLSSASVPVSVNKENPRPDVTENPKKKNTVVTVFAGLSALSLMAALLLVSSSLFPLFLVFGLLFAITAIGIYFQKKEPSNKSRHERPEGSASNETSAVDQTAYVILGIIVILIVAFFLFGGFLLLGTLSHF